MKDLEKTNIELSQGKQEKDGYSRMLEEKLYQYELQLAMLQEENTLLRDFTYNVDQEAKNMHSAKFRGEGNTQTEEKSLEERRRKLKWGVSDIRADGKRVSWEKA